MLARFGAAGERDLRDARVRRDPLAEFVVTADRTQHTCGKQILHQLDELEVTQG